MALSWVAATLGSGAAAKLGPRFDDRWRPVLALIERDAGSPQTTSAGRLFDAVAALLGVRTKITYEGQAAIELEALATEIPEAHVPAYPMAFRESDGMVVLDPAPLMGAVLEELDAGTAPAIIAAGFHQALGLGAATVAARLATSNGLDTVALSGGVFQNVRLTGVMEDELRRLGFEVLVHELVPPNDGGISVGQAAIGATAGVLGRAPSTGLR
jgi:hydrogenase maturation protein HypF